MIAKLVLQEKQDGITPLYAVEFNSLVNKINSIIDDYNAKTQNLSAIGKIDSVNVNNLAFQTLSAIVTAINAATIDANKISYSSLKDKLTGAGVVTLLAALTGGERLSYSSLKDQLTGTNLVTLLSALSGTNKLSYLSLKDTPIDITNQNGIKTENRWRIKITPANSADIDNIQLSIPKLKYNKKAFWAFTVDDAYLGVYALLQRYVNKRIVTTSTSDNFYDGKIAHDGRPRLTTTKSERYVGFTDGCGNIIPFRFGLAWFTYNGYGTDLHENGANNFPAIWWSEAETFIDFFGSIYNHELGGEDNAMVSLRSNEEIIKNKLSYICNVMVRPNGDDSYIDAAEKIDEFLLLTTEGGYKEVYPDINLFDNNDIYKLVLGRVNIGTAGQTVANRKTMIDTFIEKITNSNYPFRHEFTHLIINGTNPGEFEEHKEVLNYLHDTYGAEGTDVVWGGTLSELIEYLIFRNNAVVIRTVEGNTVVFDISLKSDYREQFKEISLLVSGVTAESEITSIIGEQYSLSKAVSTEGLLVNIGYDSKILDRADKYLSLAEQNSTDIKFNEYLQDANFFVSKIADAFKPTYEARLNALASAPILNSMQINTGNAQTANTTNSVSLNITGSATHYKIGETSDLSDAVWQIYNSSPVSYTFSDQDIETKIVYIQIKNDYGTSNIVFDSIDYIGQVLSLDSVIINSGESTTQNAVVSVGITFSNSTPTHYRIGETSDLSAITWIAWTQSPVNYTLQTTGTKRVYVQLKNATTETIIASDSITYTPINLQSISIDTGAESSADQDVSIAFNYDGTPSHYMLSESSNFVSATWIAWAGSSGSAASFALSVGNGTKTVYAKMKNSEGIESGVVSDSITLAIPSSTANKIVVSFSHDINYGQLSDANSYLTVNSEIINYISYSSYDGFDPKPLKDIAGTIKANFVCRPSLFATPEAGITLRTFDSSSGTNPVLSGNSGAYPDAYIAAYWHFGTNSAVATNWGYLKFNALAAGTYTVRILISRNDAFTANTNKIKINGVEIFIGAIPANNNSTFVEIADIPVASDGNLNIWMWNVAGIGYKPGFNLIEIIKQ